jgi:HlyD family secretion protein
MSSRIVSIASLAAVVVLLVAASRYAALTQDQDATTKKGEPTKEAQEAKEREKALKRAALEREFPIAREKLENARRELTDQAVDSQATAAKLQKELQLAKTKLETFEKREAPAKTAKAQFDLQGAKDNNDNEREELEQLELMYKEQDLADKTREIVIRRAKRALERAQQRLALQQEEFGILTERTLPQERDKLTLDVEEKQREIARAERAAQKAAGDKKVAVMAAEAEIKRIETETAAQKDVK